MREKVREKFVVKYKEGKKRKVMEKNKDEEKKWWMKWELRKKEE